MSQYLSRRPNKPSQGTSSGRIRPVRKSNHESSLDGAWEKISTAIQEIHRKNASLLSFEELYRSGYNMVLHKQGDKLYNGVRNEITTHLQQVVNESIAPSFPQAAISLGNDAVGSSNGAATTTSSDNTSSGTNSSSTNTTTTVATTTSSTTSTTITTTKTTTKTLTSYLTANMTGGPEFLKTIQVAWEDHTTSLSMIKDILMYADRIYVKAQNLPSIYDMGLNTFRDVVVRSPDHPVNNYILHTVLSLIQDERQGGIIQKSLIKSVVDMMRELSCPGPHGENDSTIYQVDFETAFLDTTRQFYHRESNQLLTECDATEYLKRAEKRLLEENERVRQYLLSSTGIKLQRLVEKEMLSSHVNTILTMENSGLSSMITHDKIEDIRRMYTLLARVANGHPEMRRIMCEHLKSLGVGINNTLAPPGVRGMKKSTSATSLNEDETATGDGDDKGKAKERAPSTGPSSSGLANPIKWVESMLTLKQKFDTILAQSLAGDKLFETDLNGALEHVVNANERAPEFVSLYMDSHLKKNVKGRTEDETETSLDQTIMLFKFIKEKDVFERYYKNHLARRLLAGKSANDDAEKTVLAKLKSECGNQFTSKMEGMFNDMRVSQDSLMPAFKSHLESSRDATTTLPTFELAVSVLTYTSWPMNTLNVPSINYPKDVKPLMERFERFYLGRHSGRRLTWQSTLGSADLKAQFAKGRKEINVTTNMMVVLLSIFNDLDPNESVRVRRIKEVTGIEDKELGRVLQSLSLGKFRILLKKNVGGDEIRDKKQRMKTIMDQDEFMVNDQFTCPQHKIKIPMIIGGASSNKAEEDPEAEETLKRVEEERKHHIEAAIVRIMKARKKMDHNNLVAEVIKQLISRFRPTPPMVKRRIEGLIDREYLERDQNDRKMYLYRA